MKREFTAQFTYVVNDGVVLVAGLADQEVGTTRYIIFQKMLCPSAQDVNLGLNKPHISLNSQAFSFYGGVESVVLTPGALRVHVSAEAAVALRTQPLFEVAITPELPGVQQLSKALGEIFPSQFSDLWLTS